MLLNLIPWLVPLSPHGVYVNLRSWLCEASSSWTSFSCGWQPTEIRTVDRHCKTRSYASINERLWLQAAQSSSSSTGKSEGYHCILHWCFYSPCVGGQRELSFSFQMFFFSLCSGFVQRKTANQLFLFIWFRFFRAELRCPFLCCSIFISVWSRGVALAADLDLFISLLLFLKNFVSNFKNRQINGKLIFGVCWSFFLNIYVNIIYREILEGDVIWPKIWDF